MILGELSIQISESYPNVIFKNEHEVDSLVVSGTYCVCNFHNMKIKSMNFSVVLGSLSIIQNRAYSVNKMLVKTPHGTHCVAGATVKSVDTTCPDQATRDESNFGTLVDISVYCQSNLFVCSDSASSCPSSGTTLSSGQGNFDITLDDGAIQFLIDGSSTGQASSYFPKFDTIAATSLWQLAQNKIDFSGEPEDPRLYLYEVFSPGYAKMWVHSSLKQYIQARPWLLSLLSLNLLRPEYYPFPLMHIPGGACPYSGPANVKTNALISKVIQENAYVTSTHLIAKKEGMDYYEYVLTPENDYIERKIPFLDGNVLILVCLIVSIVIGVFSVFAVFILMWKLKSRAEAKYSSDLKKSRKFSSAKKVNQSDNSIANGKSLVLVSEGERKRKILKMGLFTATLKQEKVEELEESALKGMKKKVKEKKLITLSFYKVIQLYIDHLRRQRINSVKMFIQHIYEDEGHFPSSKEESEEQFQQISIRLDVLVPKYLEFCTKHGLRVRTLEESKDTLNEFNLKIVHKDNKATDAYIKIRWKTHQEKNKSDQEIKLEKMKEADETNKVVHLSNIIKFLESE